MKNIAPHGMNFMDGTPSEFLNEHRQVYLMINAIAKRVRQLQLGDRALALPANGSRDPLYIAQAEFLQDKLVITERLYQSEYDDDQSDGLPDMDVLLGLDDDEVSLDASDDED